MLKVIFKGQPKKKFWHFFILTSNNKIFVRTNSWFESNKVKNNLKVVCPNQIYEYKINSQENNNLLLKRKINDYIIIF